MTSPLSMLRQPQRTMSEQLRALADRLEQPGGEAVDCDRYGTGELIEGFERGIASLLGKPAAIFLPSGTLAQPLALRIFADAANNRTIGLHPTSHLLLHEENGYRDLWQLEARSIGEADKPFTLQALQQAHAETPLSSLTWELPAREMGGQLPSWEVLVEQTDWARGQGIRVHFDGARLWQCKAAYERRFDQIAALADSVYVSFYKDLAGISGAMLLGERDFISEARIWARRAGGNLYSLYPYVVAAELGLAENLDAVDSAVSYARALGEAFCQIEGVRVVPNPPQAAMFHLHVSASSEACSKGISLYAEREGVELLQPPRAQLNKQGQPIQVIEIPIGRNALAHPISFWQQHLEQLMLLIRSLDT